MGGPEKNGNDIGGVMKYARILMILFSLALLCSPAMAETAINTGELTTSTVVCTGPCVITALFVHADGSNEATVTLYDSATASESNKIHAWHVKAGDKDSGYILPIGRKTRNGLYCVPSGTGASYDLDVQRGGGD
jgi:hypothetical protein